MIGENHIFSTLETWRLELAGTPATIIVYDENLREHFPNFTGRAVVRAEGRKSLAVAISSAATPEDCEVCAIAVMEAVGVRFDESSELHQKAVKDIGSELFSFARHYGEDTDE